MRKLFILVTLVSVIISGQTIADDQSIVVTPSGSTASIKGIPANFTGTVNIDLLLPSSLKTPSSSGLVTFSPGARTAWHSHPAGQMLIVTAGKGWVEREGEGRQILSPGDVVWIPAGVKHWHGATDITAMSHIAVTYVHDGKNVDWFEPVTDKKYLTD
ncbi:(R)-mandelonitrile lyase [Pectobacterium carotovorum]|uniref:Cupin n=1 Tax=Pectobacterium carotovorum subsp. carotovorum TaxID=555 RepID=A0AAI9L2A2_PECCC|nr:cupin domain-containing protein [Pectobacterium carotovorum]GKX48637.1 cupin [Pectobacterium carotovorum subsp. carotovorum]GLV71080.1 cupin [Pectobacterium carotovorum subsp. carotovorum]